MTAQQELPGQVSTLGHAPAAQPQVVRRATQLCLRAEPHAHEVPCPAHLSEANRQLFRVTL